MPLVTTVGGSTSDSYATLDQFRAYGEALGWAVDDYGVEATEQALRRATMYLDRNYRFLGRRVAQAQALAWPRSVPEADEDGFAIPTDSIPQPVIDAQCELAWVELQGTSLLATVTVGGVRMTRAKVGDLEEQTEYAGVSARPRFPQVDGRLRGYLSGGGNAVRLVRG